jgi:hypothetical protein
MPDNNREESAVERVLREKREAEGGEAGSDSGSNTSPRDKEATGSNEGKTTSDEQEATINDGTEDGEVVKTISGSRIPQANDVIEGRHVGRPPEEKGPREVDGSKSPHDEVSDGGSRQRAALDQTNPDRQEDEPADAREVARDGRTGVATATTPTTRPGGAP